MAWSDVQKSRAAVSLIFAVNGFLYANWVARLPRLQEIYDLDHGQLGLVLLAGSIGALVAMPLTGSVIVKAGSHRITVLMLFLFCLFIPLIPVTPNVYTLWFVRLDRLIRFAGGRLPRVRRSGAAGYDRSVRVRPGRVADRF